MKKKKNKKHLLTIKNNNDATNTRTKKPTEGKY